MTVAASTGVFSRVLCAVDGSAESLAAALQASRLVDPEGTFELLSVAETYRASRAGWLSPRVAEEIELEAEQALARAADLSPAATPHLAHGHAANVVLHTARSGGASLIAVGAVRPALARTRVIGSVANDVVRRAHCSVLVGRRGPAQVPRKLVCGVDGSPESLRALAVAEELADRFGAELTAVTGLGGKRVDPAEIGRPTRIDARPPVDALVDAGLEADLVVVGNRGLHGLLSLGSVGARVAARADCSVLVVRG